MSWPSLDEWTEALRDRPPLLGDPPWRIRWAEVDPEGRPIPRLGRFAAVYRASPVGGGADLAVRAFLTPSDNRKDHYRAISEHLLKLDRRPDSIAEFTDLVDVIPTSDGRVGPLLVMPWVDGESLDAWVGSKCEAGDREALRLMADRWLDLLRDLDEAGIVHGDLKPDNILVTADAGLRLIDYDVLGVPALRGSEASEVEPEGNPCQHPDRQAGTRLGGPFDTFAGLVLLVGLRALAVDPGLWERFGRDRSDAALLLAQSDLRDPSRSTLLEALLVSPDPEVARLAGVIFHLYEFALDELPTLGELLGWSPRASPSRSAIAPVAEPSKPARSADGPDRLPPAPTPSRSRPSLEAADGGRYYEARWNWPGQGEVPVCIVAICDRAPAEGEDPGRVKSRRTWIIQASDFALPFVIHRRDDWDGCVVAVWGRSGLGDQAVSGPSLVLGRIGRHDRGPASWLNRLRRRPDQGGAAPSG